jgi:hypothetical protein
LLNEVHFYLSASEVILLASEFRSPLTVTWDIKAWLICTRITFDFIIHFALITIKTERWITCVKSRAKVSAIKNSILGVLNKWIFLEISEREQEAL